MSQMDPRQTIPYGRKDLVYPTSNQTITNPTHTYYPITDQLQYVESRIVTQNNSSLVSAFNLNPNKLSVYQRSGQFQHQYPMTSHQTHVGNTLNHNQTHHNHNNHHQVTHKLSRPGSNKITSATNDNNSLVGSTQRNQESSLSKRPGSVSRGGIKVVSRNSSMERKSQTSVQKSITSKDLNYGHNQNNNQQKPSGIALCGMNCTTRNPFVQNEQNNQLTVVPNLGSLQTLKSGITSSLQPYSQRDYLPNHRNPSQQKLNKNFYDNISQRTHIEPSQNLHPTIKNHSQLMKENISMNGNNMQKVYKQVRQMMEKEIMVARKMYEKKYLDEIECLNTYYKSQIQTLQKVLGENLTVIEEQSNKINKLQEKIHKKQAKAEKYSQRYESLGKFIQKSNKFALQRIDQVQRKFILLLSEFQSFHLSPSDTIALQNKLSYLQQVFSTVVVKTIMKYRSIQCQIKEQVKEMMKKYDYYEEKIYEMDLMKHLGKENQIQNYRLIESIEGIKEKLVILESKAHMRSEIRELNSGISVGSDNANNSNSQTMKNVHKVEQLKRVISTMEYKLGNLQQECTQTSIKMYKLQGAKSQLQNKVSTLENQLNQTKKQYTKIRSQRDQLLKQKEQLLAQRDNNNKHNQQIQSHQSPQKYHPNTNAYNYDISSQKKSIHNDADQLQSIQLKQMKRQVERLQEIIEQYQAKIQQLHDAINNLEKENTALITALNNKKTNQEKQRQIVNSKLKLLEQQQQRSANSAQKQRLANQLTQKQLQLQQLQQSLEQLTIQKQQLQQALQTTQNIFDQQISKFKQTIRVLQEQNTQLLTQMNQMRQSQQLHLGQSSSSTKSNNNNGYQKVTLAKSPKKEMCQTVTMGWFKKSVSNQQQHQEKQQLNQITNDTVKNQKSTNYDYNHMVSGKSSPINNIKHADMSSPINQYYMETNNNTSNNYYKHSQPSQNHYRDQIKQYSNNTITQQTEQRDEFFYPQNNNNLSSHRSIDSTSIMQSNPNIAYYPTQTTSNSYYSQQQYHQNVNISVKATNNKLETQKTRKYEGYGGSNMNRFEQYANRETTQDYQEEETQTYIF